MLDIYPLSFYQQMIFQVDNILANWESSFLSVTRITWYHIIKKKKSWIQILKLPKFPADLNIQRKTTFCVVKTLILHNIKLLQYEDIYWAEHSLA